MICILHDQRMSGKTVAINQNLLFSNTFQNYINVRSTVRTSSVVMDMS